MFQTWRRWALKWIHIIDLFCAFATSIVRADITGKSLPILFKIIKCQLFPRGVKDITPWTIFFFFQTRTNELRTQIATDSIWPKKYNGISNISTWNMWCAMSLLHIANSMIVGKRRLILVIHHIILDNKSNTNKNESSMRAQ